jgi:hypothetical protein
MRVWLPSWLLPITSFSVATLIDRRWRKADPPRSFGMGHNGDIDPERDGDDNSRTSSLYLHYADLSACSLGSAKKQIRARGQTNRNLEDDQSPSPAFASGRLFLPLRSGKRHDIQFGCPTPSPAKVVFQCPHASKKKVANRQASRSRRCRGQDAECNQVRN